MLRVGGIEYNTGGVVNMHVWMSPVMGCQETKKRRSNPRYEKSSTSGEVPLALFVVLEKKGEKEERYSGAQRTRSVNSEERICNLSSKMDCARFAASACMPQNSYERMSGP